MGSNELFRQESLRKLSSPEQLDTLLRVTSPKGWLALAAVGAVLAAVVTWSWGGSIRTNVAGQGILTVRGDLMGVVAEASDALQEIGVAVGQDVRQGQVVARLSQRDLTEKLHEARKSLLELKAQDEVLTTIGRLTVDLESAAIATQREAAEITLAN